MPGTLDLDYSWMDSSMDWVCLRVYLSGDKREASDTDCLRRGTWIFHLRTHIRQTATTRAWEIRGRRGALWMQGQRKTLTPWGNGWAQTACQSRKSNGAAWLDLASLSTSAHFGLTSVARVCQPTPHQSMLFTVSEVQHQICRLVNHSHFGHNKTKGHGQWPKQTSRSLLCIKTSTIGGHQPMRRKDKHWDEHCRKHKSRDNESETPRGGRKASAGCRIPARQDAG